MRTAAIMAQIPPIMLVTLLDSPKRPKPATSKNTGSRNFSTLILLNLGE
jgi:hypothetical protein